MIQTLASIPYGEVVEVEQQLIADGLPESEVLKLCDVHSKVLEGKIDLSGSKNVPANHPIDVMTHENSELKKITGMAREGLQKSPTVPADRFKEHIFTILGLFNSLFDVDKHYRRKEYLLFPFLEREGITGPPKVMWGKHDEIRELLKGSIEILKTPDISPEDLLSSADLILLPALKGIEEMTVKEEEILFPMSMDKLHENDWVEMDQQSAEIGFCLYDPPASWKPSELAGGDSTPANPAGGISLPSGGFKLEELEAILNSLPLDISFVDRDDKVKYYSQGADRIFQRNRAILNRDVRYCHPPASAHIVDKIVDDFKSGRSSRAPFWINRGGKMIFIEYIALRNSKGEYLGTLEASHDITRYRQIEGEQRILSYK